MKMFCAFDSLISQTHTITAGRVKNVVFTLTEFHGLSESRDCNDVGSDPRKAFK